MGSQSIFKKMNASAFVFLFAVICISVFINISGALAADVAKSKVQSNTSGTDEVKENFRQKLSETLTEFKKNILKFWKRIIHIINTKIIQKILKFFKRQRPSAETADATTNPAGGESNASTNPAGGENNASTNPAGGESNASRKTVGNEDNLSTEATEEAEDPEEMVDQQQLLPKLDQQQLKFSRCFSNKSNYDQNINDLLVGFNRNKIRPALDLLFKEAVVIINNENEAEVRIGSHNYKYSLAFVECAYIIRNNILGKVSEDVSNEFLRKFFKLAESIDEECFDEESESTALINAMNEAIKMHEVINI